mmetsp:Transcript_36624/g.101705  ORF Transcript_36624/g.101705 Transcript_36624/m.101705 type:complete len:231 (-) Transcript_36624:8-700(-)
MHSSFCSRNFAISLWMALKFDLRTLIFWILSFLIFVFSSAVFSALCAFWSLFCRKASKRVTSSSSICCDFFSASSFCLAFSSSFRISAFWTSKCICIKNISRFFFTKSVTFSFSRRVSRPMPSVRWLRTCLVASGASSVSSAPSSILRFLWTRDEAVVFSQTFCVFTSSRSAARRCRSSSRMRKIWSSGGSLKGLSSRSSSGMGPSCPAPPPTPAPLPSPALSWSFDHWA